MLDKQAYEELYDGLIALEVFCENIKDAITKMQNIMEPAVLLQWSKDTGRLITKMQNIMEDDYLQHGLLPPKVRWPKDEDDNLPNVIHLHKDEDKEDKDE